MSDDYEIGYRRPPRHTRFKPGRSGNPAGRPRGSRDLKTDLQQEQRTRVTIREGGRERRVSKQRAMVMALYAKAMQGDARAAERVIDLTLRLLAEHEAPSASPPLSAEEAEILEAVARRVAPDEAPGAEADGGQQDGTGS